MSKSIIERLNRLSAEAKCYRAEVVKSRALAELQAVADSFGYSFFNWQATGRWQKYEDFETAFEAVSKIPETVETDVDLKRVETEKTPNTRLKRHIINETAGEKVCEFCLKRFESLRKEKRFCSVKCKNDFNNAKRREV